MAEPQKLTRQAAERRGRIAEWIAAASLMLRGYSIVAQRFRCRVGEIDLIARRGRTLCFIEVKARPTHDQGLEAVTPTAQQRIAAAATLWAAQKRVGPELNWRFDIVTVVKGRPKHVKDAYRPEASQRILNQGNMF